MDKQTIIESGRNLYTNSSLSSYRACPRKYYFGYHLGLKRTESKKALRMGSAFHLGQEVIAMIPSGLEGEEKQSKIDEAVLVAVADYNGNPPPDIDVVEWAVEREIVGRLLQGWAWRWANEDITITMGEVAFKQPIKNVETGDNLYRVIPGDGPPQRMELYRAGMIDKTCRLPDSRNGILEHKTTGDSIKPSSDYWINAKMSGQVTFYYKAAMDSDVLDDPQFIYYDVIRKPSIAPKKLTIGEHRDMIGIAYRKGKKTIVQPDPEKLHRYCGEDFEVQVVGTIDNEEPENTSIQAIIIDGFEAKIVASGKNMVVEETPAMFGARLMQDMIDRPDMYFARQEFARLEGDLNELEADVHQTVEMIGFCERTGQWPRNTNSCINPWKCEYLPLCSNNVQVTVGGKPPQNYEYVDFVHTELDGKMKGL